VTGYRVASLGALIDAVVQVPGSKSIANRALICAALADGESTLRNVPDGDDTQSMITCLQALGVDIVALDGSNFDASDDANLGDSTLRVFGGRQHLRPGPITLHTGLAGTTSRFLTALCALGRGPFTIDGAPPLRARPMAPLHLAMASLGASVHPGAADGHLPVTIAAPFDLLNDEVAMPGDVSSQFLTALMLVAPYFSNGLRFELSSKLVSRPYVRMTAAVMEQFGVAGVEVGDRMIIVPAGKYSPRNFTVEPDASSASYPLAATFGQVLARMGCTVVQDEAGTTVARSGPLRGLAINMADISDLVPTLAAVAAFAEGTTEIHGVGFIRHKESDRLSDLCAELRRVGVGAVDTADGLIITPGPLHMATLGTHHDHRLAMAFALVGLGASGIIVDDPEVVSKSWPGFWSMIESLR